MIYFGVIDLSSVEIYFQCKITSSVLPQQQLGHPVVFTHLFLPPPELLLELLLLGGGAPDQSELSIVQLSTNHSPPGQLADQLLLADVAVVAPRQQQEVVLSQ